MFFSSDYPFVTGRESYHLERRSGASRGSIKNIAAHWGCNLFTELIKNIGKWGLKGALNQITRWSHWAYNFVHTSHQDLKREHFCRSLKISGNQRASNLLRGSFSNIFFSLGPKLKWNDRAQIVEYFHRNNPNNLISM